MIVNSALLITGCKTPVVFQPIDQPLYPLAQAVDGPIKGAGPVFILLAWDSDAETVASQVVPNLATTVSLVTYQTTRPAFGTPAPAPLHGPAFHQGFEGHGFMPLARGEDQCHQLAPAFRTEMDFRTEAALTPAECFGLRPPWVGPSRMLVRADDGAIHIMAIPVELPCSVTWLLHRSKEAGPEAGLAPAIEAAGNGRPGAIPLGQIAPWGPCTDDPQEAVQDASVVSGWAACVRFLRRKQGL
jgi:hypothetical protein